MNFAHIFKQSLPTTTALTSAQQPSRRKLLVGGSALVGAAALAAGLPSVAEAHHDEILTLDVACDGRTWRLNRMDPSLSDQLPTRGDTFIVNGKLYPAGTIERGLSGPDQAGSIGTWICRGTFYVEDPGTQVPHVATVQMYLFDDGNGLISDGLEGGMKVRRAIIGGIGRWGNATGDASEEEVGENDTLINLGAAEVPAPNIRFVFNMTPRQ